MEFLKCLFKSNTACLSHQEICNLIDERIAFHTRGDAMEQIVFGCQESVWNAPHYAALKGEVSEHLREAELESAIILIEKQRLKQLEIEELKLRLALVQRGVYHDSLDYQMGAELVAEEYVTDSELKEWSDFVGDAPKAYIRAELYPFDEFAINIEVLLEKLSSGKLDKIGIVYNDSLSAVVLSVRKKGEEDEKL